ncbi:hypothetical protein [Caldibacillus thermoamylovorans]|uniref:hypothetical protein n=1 Tax=Caldibacillus thermoamylovorans TaxID=35841 RepID=UPI001374FB2C|nr:hypothetical protein [Caldibacillus thermoamylovorans]
MATRIKLVTVLRRKRPYFDDETESRHHFKAKNTLFWRRKIHPPFGSCTSSYKINKF